MAPADDSNGAVLASPDGGIQNTSVLVTEILCAVPYGGGGACIMKKHHTLYSIMVGSMLAALGCGSSDTSGSGGTGGDTAKGSCETICDSPCRLFERVDPASSTCLSDCADVGYAGCVTETRALVGCAEQAQHGDCSVDPNPACGAEADAWSSCP